MKRIISLLLCALLLVGCSRLEAAVDAFLGNGQSQEVEQNLAISGDGSTILTPEGGMISVITPDGSISYTPIYPDDSDISVFVPDTTEPGTCPEWMFGAWQAIQTHYMQDGWGSGSGFALYLCDNGYGVLERGEGEIHNDTFNLNYTSSRLYGPWEIQGDTFRFTVTEDWFNADGSMIGQVFEMPFTATDDGFSLEYYDNLWTFHNSTDWNGYLDIIRKADGGPTGNDLTGTRDVSDSNIDGLTGSWKMYEDEGNGYKIRHLFRFNADGSFDYTRNRMALDGSTWIPVETIDPYISYGGYYMLNGYFTIAWDCYEVSGLAVTVNGDTMTMSTIAGDFFQDAMTGVFTRCDGSANPQP